MILCTKKPLNDFLLIFIFLTRWKIDKRKLRFTSKLDVYKDLWILQRRGLVPRSSFILYIVRMGVPFTKDYISLYVIHSIYILYRMYHYLQNLFLFRPSILYVMTLLERQNLSYPFLLRRLIHYKLFLPFLYFLTP